MSLMEKSFKKGEVIVKEGDTGKSFYYLLEGTACVYAGFGKNNQFKLADIEAGEFFGEMAILEADVRSATIVAKGNVNVIEIPENELNTFLDENPEMILELMKHLGNRITAMTADYNESQALLKEMRESDQAKTSQSFFSKIKKHIDLYQSNKNKLNEPSAKSFCKAFDAVSDEGSGETESYRKGSIIYKEGDEGDCMFILHAGHVGLYSNYGKADELKSSELMAVSFFGEMGMIEGDPRSETAVAESDNTCVEMIYQEDLEPIFHSCPEKIDMILRYLSYRLRQLNIDFLQACKEITENYGEA